MTYTFRLTRDRAEWERLLGCFFPEDLDVHFYPGMSYPYECMGYEAHLAVVEGINCEAGEGLAIQPLLVDWDRKRLRHAHNFGGPLSNDGEAANHLVRAVEGWARKYLLRGQVTLPPFMPIQVPENLIHHVRNAVWVDLVAPSQLRQTTLHLVNRAMDEGYIYRPISPTREDLKTFSRIYWTTMARVGADDDWVYPPEFFPHLFIEGHAHLMLFNRLNEEPEGGCVLVGNLSEGTCYYHWAGTLNKHPRSGQSHMMVWRAIEWARNQGYRRFYLGGGRTPGDGLEVFKRGFSRLLSPVLRYEVGA